MVTPASAQVAVPTCAINAGVPPTVRAEGLSEHAGDIVLTCVGTPAAPVTGNLQVFFNTNLTSRLTASTTSEALLLLGTVYDTNSPPPPNLEPQPGSQIAGVNLFQGTVSGPNSLTFSNITVLPAAQASVGRVLRFTNLRLDASALGGTPAQHLALVTFSNPSSLVLVNPQQTVAYNGPELTFSAAGSGQCPAATGTLTFTEAFSSQFKVRGAGTSVPGFIVNDESMFVPDPTIAIVGLADTGTQLSATFTGLPAGAQISVPATATNGSLVLTAVSPAGGGSVQAANGTATVVYEVTATSYLASESVSIPFSATGVVGTLVVEGRFAPISAVAAASDTAPIPRFADRGIRATIPVAACATSPAPAMGGYGLALLALLLVLFAAARFHAARRRSDTFG